MDFNQISIIFLFVRHLIRFQLPGMQTPVRFLAAAAVMTFPSLAAAAPYAAGVTVAGDNVSFILNEPADTVKVVFNEGASTLVIGTSPVPAGLKTFSKAGFATFRIEVEKNAPPGWKSGVVQQLSDDTNDLVKFANGRGVSVNREPGSGKWFGRIYVSTGAAGNAAPVTVPPTPVRATGEGIYVLNPDLTATDLGTSAIGGIFASSGSANSPYRITVGERGDLFIADWSDVNGSVYRTDGDVTGAVNVLAGPVGSTFPVGSNSGKIHGSIAAVATTGSIAANDLKLWTIDEDLQDNPDNSTATQLNSIWAWDQGGDPLPLTNSPVRVSTTGISFVAQTTDLARGKDGYLYKLQYRAAGNESGITIINPNGNLPPLDPGVTPGTISEASRAAYQGFRAAAEPNAADPLLSAVACDISDDNWLAVMRLPDNAIHLVKIVDGKFDFNNHILLYTAPTTTQGRDLSFDIAGNLYTLSSGQNLMRVYARGGHTLAKTFSNGTFELTEPTPPVPAPPIDPLPAITGISRVDNDYLITFFSRLGRFDTHAIQRTIDPESIPWENSGSAGFPAAQFTITGTPPNFTARVIGAFGVEPRYFFRIRRN